jgi:hypothetical protein
VKNTARIVALSLVIVLCLVVFRLAKHQLRTRLAATGQPVPNQLKRSADYLAMRWIFQCFEGISLLGFTLPNGPPHRVSRVWSRCTSTSSPYWGRPVKHSTKSTIEAAECTMYLCRGGGVAPAATTLLRSGASFGVSPPLGYNEARWPARGAAPLALA